MDVRDFFDTEFGHIVVKSRRNVRNIIFRVKDGKLHITASPYTDTSTIRNSIDRKRDSIRKLLSKATTNYLQPGDVVYTHDFILIVESGSVDIIRCHKEENRVIVTLPPLDDYNNEYIQKSIGRLVRPHLQHAAKRYLPERIAYLAHTTGNHYADVTISHGLKRLGTCNTKGEISLSYHLMCLPDRLIDYVILHELAHLHELNHSRRFHLICDNYCNGNEKILEKELKQFKFPIK